MIAKRHTPIVAILATRGFLASRVKCLEVGLHMFDVDPVVLLSGFVIKEKRLVLGGFVNHFVLASSASSYHLVNE
jgi:hypothetical protein